jgi:GWxTD domain-containing protein
MAIETSENREQPPAFRVSEGFFQSSGELPRSSEPAAGVDATEIGAVVLEIDGANIPPGMYQLDIWRNDGRDTVKQVVEVSWLDKPLSLNVADYAWKMLQYITSEEQFDSLSSFASSDRPKVFYDFWRGMDPTPGTAYNEAMVEFYHRVDYAHFNYKTLEARDGALSDRGKIHILFGAPTSVERSFEGEGVSMERWIYKNNVKKKFTFESPKPGIFFLRTIEDL